MLPEQVVIAPGGNQLFRRIRLPVPAPESLAPKMPQVDMNAVAKGLPEPSPPEMLKTSASPATIKTAEPDMVNPDEWYNNKLKGAGGQDDSHLPDGSKSLSQLMGPVLLGKDSGYSRLGADLLFEYNKAVMKNSARLSMLQLAGLMMKNPDTIFIVEGHTDSFGSGEYAMPCLPMRANAVRQWPNGQRHCPDAPERGMQALLLRNTAASRPVVSTKGDRNAQAANRRVEIHMRKPGEEIPAGSLPVTCGGYEYPHCPPGCGRRGRRGQNPRFRRRKENGPCGASAVCRPGSPSRSRCAGTPGEACAAAGSHP